MKIEVPRGRWNLIGRIVRDQTKKDQPENPRNLCLEEGQIGNSEEEKEEQFTPQ